MILANLAKGTLSHPGRAALAALLILGSLAHAQQVQPPDDDTKFRIEQLEKEVHDLKSLLQQPIATPVGPDAAGKTQVAPPPTGKPPSDSPAVPDGFIVGDNRTLTASWDPGGLRFKSADEAFSVHIGGRLMTDEVWFSQSPGLKQSATQAAGSPLTNVTGVGPGIGDLLDGFFLRRMRLVADGQIYQVIEYKVEADFENYNSLLFDESYVGLRDVPFIGTIRIGQEHVPFGLEAYTSSRFLPMMERSPLFDAFYQEFAPGIFTDTTFFDQRVTTQHMFHRIDNFNQFNGASFGDGKYAYTGRVSALPMYDSDGRCLLHVAVAYQWRKGAIPLDFNGGTTIPGDPSATTAPDIVRFRVRQGIRDAVGQQGNAVRVVDTGNIVANDVQSVNGEFLWYWNSLWVQAETCMAHVDDAVYPAAVGGTPRGGLSFYGSYVQVGYFLTGDNRGYDKRMGKYDRVVPLENFFLVRDEDGHVQYGLGAWEVVYRYGYVNLDSGPVQGGTYGEHTIGLNWYWNSNVKLQFNYVNGQRIVPTPAASGTVQGFGIRAALEF